MKLGPDESGFPDPLYIPGAAIPRLSHLCNTLSKPGIFADHVILRVFLPKKGAFSLQELSKCDHNKVG
jgi:hypothetical protein